MTILCYHAVDPAWDSPLAVRPSDFAAQMEWLARRRRVMGLEAAVGLLDVRARLPRGLAALTFDDGFASVYEHAWPVLRARSLPAAIFLVAGTLTEPPRGVDWVDDPPSWPLATLRMDQVLEMQDAGVLVGSHTLTHPNLPELTDAECRRELGESRELLESLVGRRVPHLAYPRGRNDARVRRLAEAAGYAWAFTLPEAPEPTGRFGIPRAGIYRGNGIGHLALKATRAYPRVRGSRAYASVRRLAARRPAGLGFTGRDARKADGSGE